MTPGAYGVVATKSGYRRRTETLATDAIWDLSLTKTSVVSGRVIDQFGEPASGVRVNAEAISATGARGQRTTATTDDRGEFRVIGLDAGRFALSVLASFSGMATQRMPNGVMMMIPSNAAIFYPNASRIDDAELIELAAEDERDGIDFLLPAGYFDRPMLQMGGGAPSRGRSNAASTVAGRILTPEGSPIANASINLLPTTPDAAPESGSTDREGRFAFSNVTPGRFRVLADKFGFEVDARSPVTLGTPIDVAANARVTLDVRFTRLGVISGRVVDDAGDPLPLAVVSVFQLGFEDGRRQWVAAGSTRLTDDRGEYRLANLRAGQYVVCASSEGVGIEELTGFARTYFPGSPLPAQAQYVSVANGQVLPGVDIAMVRAPTVHVSGRIVNQSGQPVTGGALQLWTSGDANSPIITSSGATVLPDGRFRFANVLPGEYVIQADRGRRNRATEGEFGALRISVGDRDLANLVVRTTTGAELSGHVRFEGNPPDPAARRPLELKALPVNADASTRSAVAETDAADDGSFRLAGLHGARRLVVTAAPRGWMLKEVLVKGIDATDRPIDFGRSESPLRDVEVVLTDRITVVAGRVVDGDGRALAAVRVVAFSDDRTRWFYGSRFFASATSSDDGAFALPGLGEGAYHVVALPRAPTAGARDAWQDPAVLQSLATRATHLLVREAQTSNITLRADAGSVR